MYEIWQELLTFQKELDQFPEGPFKYVLLFPSFMNLISNVMKEYNILIIAGANLLNILNNKKFSENSFKNIENFFS